MESTLSLQMNGRSMAAESSAVDMTGQQVPLSFLGAGERAVVVKVRGKEDLQRHLENMGFVAGAQVLLVSSAAGNVIVEVKGTQIALSQQVAAKIVTSVRG